MQKWEYMVVGANPHHNSLTRIDSVKFDGSDKLTAFLAGIGEEGWELISATGDNAFSDMILIFKRPSSNISN